MYWPAMSVSQDPRCTQVEVVGTFILPGAPIATEAVLFDEALDDFIDALKGYAEDWLDNEVLQKAPSHRGNLGLVQLVSLLTEEELREWALNGVPAQSGSSS